MSFREASCIAFRISAITSRVNFVLGTYVTYMSIGECRQEKKLDAYYLARNVVNLYLRTEHTAVIAGLWQVMHFASENQ